MTTTTLRNLSLAVSVACAVAVSGCGGGSGARQASPVAFNAVLDRDYPGRVVKLAGADSHVKAFFDHDDDGVLRVVYVVDGVEHEVGFTQRDAERDYDGTVESYARRGDLGDPWFSLWDHTGFFTDDPEFEHFAANGWSVCTSGDPYEDFCPSSEFGDHRVLRGYVVHGEPTAVLPRGTADYEGRTRWDGYRRGDPSTDTSRTRYRASMTLTADFDNRTIGGTFHDWERRERGASSYEPLAADPVMEIRNGTIGNTRLSADLTDSDRPEFTGRMVGQLFGPDAAEVGGVVEGEDDARVYQGWFGGKKQ